MPTTTNYSTSINKTILKYSDKFVWILHWNEYIVNQWQIISVFSKCSLFNRLTNGSDIASTIYANKNGC